MQNFKKKTQLHRAIQNKRHAVLLHDNVHLHTAARTRALLKHFNWEFIDHPPYSPSPDLALSNYHLFTYLKNCLGSQPFNNDEWMEGVKMWLSPQVAEFFDTGIQKLIPRYKCLNSSSDYVEK
jgi:hypothetical protein